LCQRIRSFGHKYTFRCTFKQDCLCKKTPV